MTKFQWMLFPALVAGVVVSAGLPEHKAEVLKTPGLIRFHTFEEGRSEEVANHAPIDRDRSAVTGGPLGSLTILRLPPNGLNPRSSHGLKLDPTAFFSAVWTQGRFPGKAALTSAFDDTGLWRSGITGREFAKGGTFAGWLRPHPAPLGTGSALMTLGDCYNNGFKLYYAKQKWMPQGGIGVQFGGPEHAGQTAQGVPETEWTNFAVTFGDGKIVLYLNGKPVAEKPFKGPVVPVFIGDNPLCGPFHEFHRGRYGEYLHILRNGRFNPARSAKVDLDELTIFDRPLGAAEVAKLYESGKPAATPAEQRAEFARVAADKALADSIEIEFPKNSNDYYRIDSPIPVTVRVPAAAGNLTASFALETLRGEPLMKFERPVPAGTALVEKLKMNRCGVFYLDVTLRNAAGKVVKTLPAPHCFAVVPPKPRELSKHNPLGFWAEEDEFCYDAPLRRMNYHPDPKIRREMFKKYYDLYRSRIPNFRPLVWFYARCIREKSPEDRPFNRAMFKEAVEFLKDKPLLGFEVSSEPHDVDPKWYAKMLGDLREIADAGGLKNVPIVPPGGAPPSIPMIAAILEAGGIKYVDGVSFHPYTACPIGEFLWGSLTPRLQEVVRRYPEKKLAIWNTEGGVNSLPRIKNRPMTFKDAHSARMRSTTSFGQELIPYFISMMPEDEAAALQCQAALLDMLKGYQTYIVCQSPNLDTGCLPSLRGVALTAMAGQVLNYKTGVTRVPLAVLGQMCLLVQQADGSRIAALFALKNAEVRLKMQPGATCRTMDMLGNFGTIKADADGVVKVAVSKHPFYIFGVPANLSEIVALKVSAPDKLPENRILNAEVTVANPFRHRLTGTVSPMPVKGAELTPARTEVDLAPGETRKIALTLTAAALKRRPYTLGVTLRDKAGRELANAETMFTSPGVIQLIPRARKPIRLDGDESEWAKIPEVAADDVESVVHGKPNYAEVWLPQWKGRDDLSFTLKTAWRKNDGVYFLLKVTDDKLVPAPAGQENMAFRYDCLELFFDSREPKRQGTEITPGADQTIVIPAVGEKVAPCKLWHAKRDNSHIAVECVGKRIPGGYLIEGKIAPTARSRFKVEAGSQFRMDFLVDDTDEPVTARLRKAAMALHGQFANYNNSNLWGRYELSLD